MFASIWLDCAFFSYVLSILYMHRPAFEILLTELLPYLLSGILNLDRHVKFLAEGFVTLS